MRFEDIPDKGCMFNTGKNKYALERDKFCGEPSVEGKPYCDKHCKRAYRQWNLSTPVLEFDPYSEAGKGDVFDPHWLPPTAPAPRPAWRDKPGSKR